MHDSEHPTDRSPPPAEEPTDPGGHEDQPGDAGNVTLNLGALVGVLQHLIGEVAGLRRDLTRDQEQDAELRRSDSEWRRKADGALSRIESTLATISGSLELVVHEHQRQGQRLAAVEASIEDLPCHGRVGCPTAAE